MHVILFKKNVLYICLHVFFSSSFHWSIFHSEVFLIQHYVIKFVSHLRQVVGFLQVLWFPPPIKLMAMIYNVAEILLKVALNTINQTKPSILLWSACKFKCGQYFIYRRVCIMECDPICNFYYFERIWKKTIYNTFALSYINSFKFTWKIHSTIMSVIHSYVDNLFLYRQSVPV